MGDMIGLDYTAVIETLKLYDEGREMFEEILVLFNLSQEIRNEKKG